MSTGAIDTTIALLYAQTTYASKIAHETVVAPQAGQAMARAMVNEAVQKEEKKVPTAEKGDKSKLSADKDSQKGSGFGNRRRRARRPPIPPIEEESAAEPPAQGDIFSGNLLNIKV